MRIALVVLATVVSVSVWAQETVGTVSAADYPSIQAAIDANPGKMIAVPSGDHEISTALRISTDNTGLCGFGRIVQLAPDQCIIEIRNARDVRIRDLTLTRKPANGASPESWREVGEGGGLQAGIDAAGCDGLEIESVRVVDNKSANASIRFHECIHSSIRNCEMTNYKRTTIDDRTENELYGYAFQVIDGFGIICTTGRDIAIVGNRIVERDVLPAPELKEKHGLGKLVEGKKPTKKGRLAPPGDYGNNWHQGSAIMVTHPETTDFVRISDNYLEGAAQGIDIHADHVICSGNLINGAFIGVKSMHGARNVMITNNNMSRIDLWGICMQPGTLAHAAVPATETEPARPANLTAGTIIANNIFSDIGRGPEAFNWKDNGPQIISLQWGPLPEYPPMTDVLVVGNIVYDAEQGSGPPLYRHALFLDDRLDRSRFTIKDNIFHPGTDGVSNAVISD